MKVNKAIKASKIKRGKLKKNRRTFIELSPSITSTPSSLYNSLFQIENYNEHLEKKNLNPKTLCGVVPSLPSRYADIYRRNRMRIDERR